MARLISADHFYGMLRQNPADFQALRPSQSPEFNANNTEVSRIALTQRN